MKQLKIDSSGDVVIERGNLVLVDDVAQRVTTRLRMLLGEWFLDRGDGTPYLQQILVKNPNVDLIRSALRARVLGTPGVTAIISFELDFDRVRRRLSLSMTAAGPRGTFEVVI